MDDATRDRLLDLVRDDQLALGAELAKGLQEHQAWQDFLHEVKLAGAQFGKEAVQDALPFLLAALKVAIAAA